MMYYILDRDSPPVKDNQSEESDADDEMANTHTERESESEPPQDRSMNSGTADAPRDDLGTSDDTSAEATEESERW